MKATVDAVAACSADVVEAMPCELQVESVGQWVFASLLSELAIRPNVVPTMSPARPTPPVTSPIVRCPDPWDAAGSAGGAAGAGDAATGAAGIDGDGAGVVSGAASARAGTSM